MVPHFTARRTSVAIFRESGRRSSLGEGGVLYGIITEVRAEIMANASYPKDSYTITILFYDIMTSGHGRFIALNLYYRYLYMYVCIVYQWR
jgi:hypothetical protein